MKILLRVDDCGITGVGLGANALDRTFEYDPLYRVVSGNGRESDTQNQNDYLYSDAPAPGSPNADDVRAYARQYNYDKIGNVQQVTQSGTNGFTRNFVYNTGVNTLQQIETGSSVLIQDFTYDTVGNQITAGTTRNYVWNAGNQLITYYNQAGTADPTIFAQYDYSGMNRVSKMVRTGTAGSPIYERTIYIDGIFEYHILENGTTYEKNYVHVMDDQSRIAMVRIGTPFPDDITNAVTYNLEDQIGSSSVRLNTTGGVIDKEEYYPFGDSSLRTFTKKRYRYVGKEKDLESGLYYYGARYYAAWTCRFISVDPLAADYPFYTPYNYAGNKPINKIDIDGMQQEGAPTVPVEVQDDTVKPEDNTSHKSGNLIIVLGDENTDAKLNGYMASKEEGSTWDFIYADTIEDLATKVDDYLKDSGRKQLKNLVFHQHGSSGGVNVSTDNELDDLRTTGTGKSVLKEPTIRGYMSKTPPSRSADMPYPRAVANFMHIMSKVENGGNIVFATCYSGSAIFESPIGAFGKAISDHTGKRANIYLNIGYTPVQGSKMLNRTLMYQGDKGWVKIESGSGKTIDYPNGIMIGSRGNVEVGNPTLIKKKK